MRIFCICLTSVWSIVAHASPDFLEGTVNFVEARSNGEVTIFLKESVSFTQGCTYSDRAGISSGDSNKNTMAAVAMMALASGKRLSYRIDGCAGFDSQLFPGETVPRITRISVLSY